MATDEKPTGQSYKRMSDIVQESNKVLTPIHGYENAPLLSLEEAVAPLVPILPRIENYAQIAKERCEPTPANGLTKDESASIILYTMEWEPQEQCLYFVLNATLRAEKRQNLKLWFLYLKLILTGLYQLPSLRRPVYRGIKVDLSKLYPVGKTFIWWGFSSCALNIGVLESEQFIGKTGTRTLFIIDGFSGKDVRRHSYHQSEEEILFLPARKLQVLACFQPSSGLHMIQLKEIESSDILLSPIVVDSDLHESPSEDLTNQSLDVLPKLNSMLNVKGEIVHLLQLDEDENKDQIINDLLENGRQSLKNHEDNIIVEIYRTQMNDDDNDLMKLLKTYFEQKWKTLDSSLDKWFISFIEQYKAKENPEWYEQVLTRAADNGNKHMKNNPVLSISFQLLFEGIDDRCLNETKIFDELWSTVTTNGLKSITKYSDYIIEDVMNELLNKKQPILFQALREYCRQDLFNLLKESSITDRQNLYQLALDNIAEYGWKIGLETIRNRTTPRHFKSLSEKLESYLQKKQEENEALTVNNSKDELNIVLNCTKVHADLFVLQDLVQAGEMQYINQTLKGISDNLVDDFLCQHYSFPDFIHKCLIPIMYLVKRLQNLDDFMTTLISKYRRVQTKANFQSTETANLSLRMLLHVLFMRSDVFLKRIIMSLTSKRNPIPFVSPNILTWNQNEQYEFMPAIIHVWNYTRPTILSFGIGPCKGKSTLLNQLFQSTFEQTVDSIYFRQTIDIDFGYCFNPERTLNIADTHGIIDKKLLCEIQPLFDGFIIQIDKTYLDKQSQLLLDYIQCLSTDKFRMIIIRDTPKQNLSECSMKVQSLIKQSESELSQNLHIYPMVNTINTNDRNIGFAIERLRKEMLREIKEQIPVNRERKDEILLTLRKLLKKDYIDYLKQMDKIIQPLKQRLLQRNEYQNEQNFPLYLKFQQLCKLRQKLKKLDFYGSESDKMFEIHSKLYELECQLDPNTKASITIKYGYVFDAFIEILKSENMLMSLDLLVSELKTEVLSLGGDKLAGNLSVETAFLSLEVLWRNAIVCYDHTTKQNQDLITKSYHDFVAAGFPFEIIDGDNFHFQNQFLTKILNEFASQRILVISIIGLQNSGKSTLLNYMFGTLFDVREGRCTRGIYGSLVKLDKSNQSGNKSLSKDIKAKVGDIDYIMLIDTEGLLSIEKGDKEYDRRLVLFALAVSHLVIVNMMGDINQTLQDMLTLCADSLKQIGVNTTNHPIVHFVLNQKADLNLQNHMEAIEKVIKNLKEKELAEIIDISPKTFHTLPSAFKKERISTDTTSPCFLRTEPDFIERTQQLCEKIIESAKSSYDRTRDMFSDAPQWLRTAVNIFDTLQKFPDLTYFKDINERRQDDKIRLEIRDLLAKTLTPAYREKLINETCELTEYEIRQRFLAEFDVHQENFDINLENIFKVTNASEYIRDRCKKFLKQQITDISNAWCTAAIQAHDQKQMKGLVRDGSADLRHLIDDFIKNGKTMTKKEAAEEFETMWSKTLEPIRNNFNPEERLQQAIKFVYGNYNIFEKQALPDHEIILQNLSFIVHLSQQSSVNEVIKAIQRSFVQHISQLQMDTLEVSWKSPSTSTEYTLATLHNFKHLNKQTLTNLNAAGSFLDEKNYSIQPMDLDNPPEQSSEKSTKSSVWGSVKKDVNVVKDTVASAVGSKSTHSPSSEKQTTASKSPPLRFDFMKTVHHMIHKESGSVQNTKSNILDIIQLFDTIIDETIKTIHGNDTNVRPIEIDLIQKIVGLINTNINEINLELLVFKLLLSKQTISFIHIHILILITIFYYNEQKNHFIQQLQTLEEQKSSLLTYFISMVVPDAECDKEGARIFANQIKNAIQSNLIRDAKIIITRAIQYHQENLSRKHIQNICDGKLLTAASSNNWLYRYIDASTDIIVEEFKVLWEAVENTINQQLEKEKNRWKNVLSEFFNRIDFMSSSLTNEGSSVQYIDDIFEATGGTAEENLKNKGQCMVLLLYTYLSGDAITAGACFTVFGKKYTLKSKGLKLFEKLPKPTDQLSNIVKGMQSIDNSNGNHMKIDSIKNLHVFLQSITDVKSNVEDTYDNSPATFTTFDKDQIYNKLLDKARGCTAKCPCCDRPCDVDHTVTKSNPGDEDNRHACQTGHQLRAMAGIQFEVSNEASLFQCEQVEDNKPIVVRGTKKKWSEFKKDHPDWDFGNSIGRDELDKLHGKFLHVWGKIGRQLCAKYPGMKFVTMNTPQAAPKPFHYIFMLDASGSMSGKPWDNLMDGVKEFVKIRTESSTADRITIIVFNDTAKYAYFNVDSKQINIKEIKFTNGPSANFGTAFDLVIQTMKNLQPPNTTSNAGRNLEYIIIFMSDGQASFPAHQLDTLLTMKKKINQFWTVALGKTKMDVLEQITHKMNGTFKELKDSADLVDVYAEIVRY